MSSSMPARVPLACTVTPSWASARPPTISTLGAPTTWKPRLPRSYMSFEASTNSAPVPVNQLRLTCASAANADRIRSHCAVSRPARSRRTTSITAAVSEGSGTGAPIGCGERRRCTERRGRGVFDTPAPDAFDVAGGADVGERVAVDEDQIGTQAGFDGPAVAETEVVGG